MYFSKQDLAETEKIKRLNIINSVSGIKPANLIGTKSNTGISNLAIFSSIVHLGSNPAHLAFVMRPSEEVRRHTYENILENGCFTINHIHSNFIEQAHYTSAKFDADISEFETCGFTEEYLMDFSAPFVKESTLKIGMRHVESIPIKSTNTILVVGQVQHLFIPDHAMDELGQINLSLVDDVGISGLNSYYQLQKLAEFPYARVSELPDFKS
jgi:flavin reductase (DIM6/NTAB) family NADH-FMN oxidoreductase RutF